MSLPLGSGRGIRAAAVTLIVVGLLRRLVGGGLLGRREFGAGPGRFPHPLRRLRQPLDLRLDHLDRFRDDRFRGLLDGLLDGLLHRRRDIRGYRTVRRRPLAGRGIVGAGRISRFIRGDLDIRQGIVGGIGQSGQQITDIAVEQITHRRERIRAGVVVRGHRGPESATELPEHIRQHLTPVDVRQRAELHPGRRRVERALIGPGLGVPERVRVAQVRQTPQCRRQGVGQSVHQVRHRRQARQPHDVTDQVERFQHRKAVGPHRQIDVGVGGVLVGQAADQFLKLRGQLPGRAGDIHAAQHVGREQPGDDVVQQRDRVGPCGKVRHQLVFDGGVDLHRHQVRPAQRQTGVTDRRATTAGDRDVRCHGVDSEHRQQICEPGHDSAVGAPGVVEQDRRQDRQAAQQRIFADVVHPARLR
ncbi:MAG: hypothetical protein U5N53_27915 [Mycobacterium sp.]|nr:hypothetical protein [Mycobacterium sp.]